MFGRHADTKAGGRALMGMGALAQVKGIGALTIL